MFGWLTKNRPGNTKAIEGEQYAAATVTLSERNRTRLAANITARQLVASSNGLPGICADTLATDCAQQPLRLYRVGTVEIMRQLMRKGKAAPIDVRTRRYLSDKNRVGLFVSEAMRKARARLFNMKATQYADTGGNVAEVTDHPALDLMRRPNPSMSGTDAAHLRFWFKNICGQHFDALVNGEGGVTEIWPMYAHATEPLPGEGEGLVRAYAYGRERTGVIEIPPEDVLDYKHQIHPTDPYHGYGPLHVCFDSAQVLSKNTQFDLEMIENGNIPPGLISVSDKVYPTVDAVSKLMKDIRTATRGVRGKADMLAVSGASFVDMTKAGKELQSIERINYHESRVRQAYGIPETVLNNKASAYASAETGDDAYWAGAVRPRLVTDAEQLTRMVLPLFGIEPGEYFFAYDDPVLEDARAEAEIAEIDLRSGVRNINEVRAERNMSGIGEDGDVYRINGVPVDESGQLPPSPQPFSFTLNSGEPAQIKAGGPEACACGSVPALPPPRDDGPEFAGIAEHHKRATFYTENGPPCGCTKAVDENAPLEIPDDNLAGSEAARATDAANAAYREYRDVLEEYFRDVQEETARSIRTGDQIDLEAMEDQLARNMMPAARRLYEAGFRLGGVEVDQDNADLDPFQIVNAEAVEAIYTSFVREMSRDISDTTAQDIERFVRTGIEEGQSTAQIADAIEEDTGYSAYRSEMIARTETNRSLNVGKMERYRLVGVERKVSRTAPGASSVHLAIEKSSEGGIPLEQPFVRSGDTVRGADGTRETYSRDYLSPPYRPNCRCALEAVLEDDE